MTQVDFHFITPTGDPIQNGFVEIVLSESAWLEIESGVVIPRVVFGYTDDDGRISFELWPVKTAEYTITVTDTHKDNEVVAKHYFYVPRAEVPVRLQDILMDPPPSPKPYDEASIRTIIENRISAQHARDLTDELHEQVIVREANVTDMQADVTQRQAIVQQLHDQSIILKDTALGAEQGALAAQDSAETAQAASEAALAQAVDEAIKANTSRVAAEQAQSATQSMRSDVSNMRQQTLEYKNASEAAAATAEDIVVTHELKSDPHAQYLLRNDATATYETLVGALEKLADAKAYADTREVYARERANHTGFQAMETVSGLLDALANKLNLNHAQSDDHDARYYTKQQAEEIFTKPRMNNYDGMRAPLETDDEEDGYERGSSWFDQTTGIMWVCTASTVGAAHWMQTSINVNEIGSAAMEDVAVLVARANHTGTQAITTVDGLEAALAGKADASHDHEGVYLTLTEIEALVASKIDEYHTTHHVADPE